MTAAPQSQRPTAAAARAVLPALDAKRVLACAHDVIDAEAYAVKMLRERIGESFVTCTQYLAQCTGRIVVTGMGKSGIVGQKISATFASTGAPSLFMHAAEAIHGDLGRITSDDVVLALSNSGQSEEVVRLIRPVKAMGAKLLGITSAANSTLARMADAAIVMGDVAEACPMNLVPTASTTAMLVLGDALAMTLFEVRGLGHDAFARFHPGGALGRKLMKVGDIMRTGAANPIAQLTDTLRRVIAIMSETAGRPGAASVVDARGKLAGFFTDGDLRRLLERPDFSVDVDIAAVMHHDPKRVFTSTLVSEAAALLHAHQIDQLPVVDTSGAPVGLIDVQDVLSL